MRKRDVHFISIHLSSYISILLLYTVGHGTHNTCSEFISVEHDDGKIMASVVGIIFWN